MTEPSPQSHMATSFVFVYPYVYGGVCIAMYMGKREENFRCPVLPLSPLRQGLTLNLELPSFSARLAG